MSITQPCLPIPFSLLLFFDSRSTQRISYKMQSKNIHKKFTWQTKTHTNPFFVLKRSHPRETTLDNKKKEELKKRRRARASERASEQRITECRTPRYQAMTRGRHKLPTSGWDNDGIGDLSYRMQLHLSAVVCGLSLTGRAAWRRRRQKLRRHREKSQANFEEGGGGGSSGARDSRERDNCY